MPQCSVVTGLCKLNSVIVTVMASSSSTNANSQAAANADGNADEQAKTNAKGYNSTNDDPDNGGSTCKKKSSHG